MDISIILCTHNRSESLKKVLESLEGLRGYPHIAWEIIVVDNNSKDQTKEVIKNYIQSGVENVRYAFEGLQEKSFALNTGIEAAKGNVLVFTDDDVMVHPKWLSELKKSLTSMIAWA